jgi:transcriptional regulator with XRE-family HTH domain
VLLGGLVRAHRARLRLTQEQLAERAGLSERTLRNLEGDRIRRPYPDTIRRLADALQLTGAHRDQLEAAARGVAPEVAPEPTVPSLLPPSVTDFTGREEEVAAVLGLLASDGVEEAAHAVVISAVAGKPGIGKTTLAVHIAHRLRSEFPDGQLYVNLKGAQARPLDPSEVLARFLRALGMHGSSIPDDLEERAERYRTLLADRRMLVVLDNAAGEPRSGPCCPAAQRAESWLPAGLAFLVWKGHASSTWTSSRSRRLSSCSPAWPGRPGQPPNRTRRRPSSATAAACRWRSGSPGHDWPPARPGPWPGWRNG